MATITEDYCSQEVYRLLREKGFDGEIHTTFDEEGYTWASITQQMAMRWLREVHNIHIGINPISGKGYNATIYDVADFDDYGIIDDTKFFFHVEEACEAAINYCLENLI